jgi:hypothetical protein
VSWLSQTVRSDSARPAHRDDRASVSSSVAPVRSQNSPSMQQSEQRRPRSGFYRGPTSMAYNMSVANNTISNMGYRGIVEDDEQSQPPEFLPPHRSDDSYDPLFDFGKDEMVRLCRVHEEEVGIMYPVLDIQSVISHAKSLANFLETNPDRRSVGAINDQKTLELKMVMCSGLVVEEHAHSERAAKLLASMEHVINRKLLSDVCDVSNLPLLALFAGYRFLANEEVLAWRVIGQVTRLCLELGIHQASGLAKIQDETRRRNALNTFWTAYVLDRRWAFGTGLPYVLQDDEIDPRLPFPDEYPFLVAMITYSRLGSKVWRQVSHFGPVLARELRHEEIERLDQEILQWYESVPDEIKVRNWDKERAMVSTPSYNLQRLRIWTYLRLNQLRIWLYTPTLHTATSIMSNPLLAQRAVDLAKDTIQYLNHLNTTTNLYRKIQIFYHQFLTSAISVVFLASVHAPVRFSAVCREEFYMALDLVKDLSEKSWVSKRLWNVIKSLRDVAPRFGLNPDEDAHSTAALGMLGLARGDTEPEPDTPSLSDFQRRVGSGTPGMSTPEHNGSRIQTEMSRIFEGYVSLNGVSAFQYAGGSQPMAHSHSNPEMTMPEGTGAIYSADGTVFPHLREMF